MERNAWKPVAKTNISHVKWHNTGCCMFAKLRQLQLFIWYGVGLYWHVDNLALWAVSSNWRAIDLTRCTDSPQRSLQFGRQVLAGQPCDLEPVLQEKWGNGAGEHVSSPHVMCMSVQTFSSRFLHFFFWCCLWFPRCPILLVPTMHDGERQLITCLFF